MNPAIAEWSQLALMLTFEVSMGCLGGWAIVKAATVIL